MSQTFLERNKKKSLAALLLLLLRWKRGLAPLLVMVFLLMLVFIAPTNLLGYVVAGLERLPMGHRVAAALVRLARPADKRAFNDMLAALKAARDDKRAGWGVFDRGTGAAPGQDSLKMVRGSQGELAGRGNMAEKLAGARTVNGVLTPEDAEKGAQGVALSDEDIAGQNGLVRAAEAGVMGTLRGGFSTPGAAAGKSAATGAFLAGVGPYAGRGTLAGAGPRAAVGDNVTTALGSGKIPPVSTKIVPGEGGRLSRRALVASQSSRDTASNRNALRGGLNALRQLSDGRARAQVSRDPVCTAASGCPNEYASANTSAIYDGNRIGINAPGVLLAGPAVPGVDGIDTGIPVIPNDATLQRDIDAATKIQEDAKKCQEADVRYKPAEDEHARKINELSDQMLAMDCGGGGCSKSKANRCKAKGNEMKEECRALDLVMRDHYNACPLMQEEVQPDGSIAHREYVAQDCN